MASKGIMVSHPVKDLVDFKVQKYGVLTQPRPAQTDIGKGNESLWKMFFDGSQSKEGSGAGVVIISPSNQIFPFSFKL